MKKIYLLNLILVSMIFNINGQETEKKVAVFDPVGEISQNIKLIVREELSNSVVNTTGFTVLERELIDRILAENEFQMTGHVDDSQIGELGKKMGANYVCYASISPVNKNYYISCKLVDVTTAKIEKQNTGTTQSGLNDLNAVVSNISREMLQYEGTKDIQQVTKLSTPININDADKLWEFSFYGVDYQALPKDLPGTYKWEEAKNACKNYEAFGYNDWQLPAIESLQYLYNNKNTLNLDGRYWSATPRNPEKANFIFEIDFKDGQTFDTNQNAKRKVRCIRKK